MSSTEGQIPETCPVQKSTDHWSRHVQLCGKPIKRNGKCGIHAAAEERRAKNSQKWKDDREKASRVLAGAKELCEKLDAAGIRAVPHYAAITRDYDGRIVIPASAVPVILAALGLEG